MISPISYPQQSHFLANIEPMIIRRNEINPYTSKWPKCVSKKDVFAIYEKVLEFNFTSFSREKMDKIEEYMATACCTKRTILKKSSERMFDLWNFSIAHIKKKAKRLYQKTLNQFVHCNQNPKNPLIKQIHTFKWSLNQTILNKQIEPFSQNLSLYPLIYGEFLITFPLSPQLLFNLSREANRTQSATENVVQGVLCFKQIGLLEQKNKNYLNLVKELDSHFNESEQIFNHLKIKASNSCPKLNETQDVQNQLYAKSLLKDCTSEIEELETQLEFVNLTAGAIQDDKDALEVIMNKAFAPMYNKFEKNLQKFDRELNSLTQCKDNTASNNQSLENCEFTITQFRKIERQFYDLEEEVNACKNTLDHAQSRLQKKESLLETFFKKLETIIH